MSIPDLDISGVSLMQLSDSFFPTGMYTTSSGLEALYYQKKIKGADAIEELIKVYLQQQIGPADCVALGTGWECAKRNDLDELILVDKTLYHMRLVREVRDASTRSGTQLLRCVASFVTDDAILKNYLLSIKSGNAAGIFPVALAVAGNALAISKQNAGLALLYSFTVSIVGSALRLGMLQHFEGQKIIHRLKPDMIKIVQDNINRPLSSIWQFAPGIDIVQISHEKMNSKMFIT